MTLINKIEILNIFLRLLNNKIIYCNNNRNLPEISIPLIEKKSKRYFPLCRVSFLHDEAVHNLIFILQTFFQVTLLQALQNYFTKSYNFFFTLKKKSKVYIQAKLSSFLEYLLYLYTVNLRDIFIDNKY